ncbi:alpha-2,3-sialyltransferase [Hyphococcus flavus]|uniref:Alpha-2,3-sialyltransferase n=1 Tax=Hyphococcus flavus TaxID=1866326 RepID=A0AAF0CGK5_9PROT|nr:alpha-2,3-sialyltransferase [Hyphococcus flavus]WDI32489.1 alpha-2,3-sialyltransferase [Hyphococcus flavus]
MTSQTENSATRRLTAPAVYPSKLYGHFSIGADPVTARLHARRKEPLFIICPGPTSLEIDPAQVVGNGVIFRMNTFFIEEQARFSKKIDAYFWSNGNDVLYDELQRAIEVENYEIDSFFSPLLLRREDKNPKKVREYQKLFQPASDHWAVIGLNPVLGREMMGRPLPTQAFQTLATGAVMGFEEIHLIGVDMYSDKTRRYAYDYPERMKAKVDEKHYAPSYERGAHGHERDLIFLETIRSQFPNTRIYNASRVSPLKEFLPNSPLMENAPLSSVSMISTGAPKKQRSAHHNALRHRVLKWARTLKAKTLNILGAGK